MILMKFLDQLDVLWLKNKLDFFGSIRSQDICSEFIHSLPHLSDPSPEDAFDDVVEVELLDLT